MARFDNSIDRDPVGSGLPSDFTQLGGTISVAVQNDTTPRITNTVLTTTAGTASAQCYFNTAGSTTDGEILALFRTVLLTTSINATSLVSGLRGSTSVFPRCTAVNLLGNSTSGGNTIRISNFSSASGLTALASATFNFTYGSWYWVRFTVTGSSYFAKAWSLGSTEPSASTVTVASTVNTTGVFELRLTSTAVVTQTYAWFSVATGGEIAPGPGYAFMHTLGNSDINASQADEMRRVTVKSYG